MLHFYGWGLRIVGRAGRAGGSCRSAAFAERRNGPMRAQAIHSPTVSASSQTNTTIIFYVAGTRTHSPPHGSGESPEPSSMRVLCTVSDSTSLDTFMRVLSGTRCARRAYTSSCMRLLQRSRLAESAETSAVCFAYTKSPRHTVSSPSTSALSASLSATNIFCSSRVIERMR
ncbi:PP167 [Orf virus]|uniref:PP167 n=1 Tax=Orf virus TaxID=10258 RepID=F1AWZ4_ORFV|nr:PP167 [Orf virus]